MKYTMDNQIPPEVGAYDSDKQNLYVLSETSIYVCMYCTYIQTTLPTPDPAPERPSFVTTQHISHLGLESLSMQAVGKIQKVNVLISSSQSVISLAIAVDSCVSRLHLRLALSFDACPNV